MTLAECIERNLADRERELAQSTTETPASPQPPSPRAVEAPRAPETSVENLPAVRSGSGLSAVVPDTHQRARQLQARHRTQEALALRRQGQSQGLIAEHLGISQQAVSKMLRRADQKALRAMERDAGLVKLRQSERLDELYAELMIAWRDGQNDRTLTRKRNRGADGFEDTTERRSGKPDPRYVDLMLRVLEAQRKLLGLELASSGTNISIENLLVQLLGRIQPGHGAKGGRE